MPRRKGRFSKKNAVTFNLLDVGRVFYPIAPSESKQPKMQVKRNTLTRHDFKKKGYHMYHFPTQENIHSGCQLFVRLYLSAREVDITSYYGELWKMAQFSKDYPNLYDGRNLTTDDEKMVFAELTPQSSEDLSEYYMCHSRRLFAKLTHEESTLDDFIKKVALKKIYLKESKLNDNLKLAMREKLSPQFPEVLLELVDGYLEMVSYRDFAKVYR